MNNKTEAIKKWVIKGDHDLGTAMITHQHIPAYRDTIAFHCQQSTEKYLKAYLIYLDIEFMRFHDLIYLAELINQKDSNITEFISKLSELENFAVEIRYPDSVIDLTEQEITSAISISKEIRVFVIKKMNIVIDKDDIINL